MEYLIISFLWIAYCALHSYLISTKVTNSAARILKKYYAFYRLFYVALSLVLLIPLIKYTVQYNGGIILSYGPALNIIRLVLMYASFLIFFLAFFFSYDPLHFFGIRQIMNMGKSAGSAMETAISRKGLLGIIRHPMYLALIIFLWTQVFTLTDIIVNTILTVYVIIGTWLEEKKLILEFGDAYVKYQHEVPMLIPFTKPKPAGVTAGMEERH